MKKIGEKAEELISNMRTYFLDKVIKRNYVDEEPLRSELFTAAQMQKYSKSLAENHKLNTKRGKDQLLKRLADNEKILLEVRTILMESLNANYLITPAGEWLMDNFYLIEDQIRTTKKHLPKGYSENLPQLTSGLTRVYDIALQIISHSDGRIDLESLSGFITSYQTVTQLQLGELWAIPIMLRLSLIENLRRVSVRIAIDRIDRNLADFWSKEMIETSESSPQDLIVTIAEMARSRPPLVSAFVAEINRQLNGKGPGLALALNWIEQRLSENGTSSADLVFAENQKQAADQVSMRNSIGSLRTLTTLDWRDFVEEHSVVEQELRKDPARVYSLMDFPTRDRYRHVVENLAQKSTFSEKEIAEIAINLSLQAKPDDPNYSRVLHVGYFLVGDGLYATYKQAKAPRSFFEVYSSAAARNALFFYISFIFLITAGVSLGVYLEMRTDPLNHFLLAAVVVLSVISASQLAITLVNFFCTLIVKPKILSRLDYSQGIPLESNTLVVIPVLLSGIPDIDNLTEALEVRFLANRSDNLRFGLLTDFSDAPSETLPGDNELLNYACDKIEDLNKKYKRAENDLFYLFHRPRRWNPADKVWMGYERKRGKLSDLNALLRGKGKDRFSHITGNIESLQQVTYVITLDADTQLPHGAAWKLAATMAHPLNRAFYNEKKQRVTEGYGILQPRVNVSLPEMNASHYAKLHGNEPGIDPYTRATSDVYQDLFSEGSFIGKGIYDVDIFEKALGGRFPENRILSHDLLEGCYARSGLLSDVQLYEKYPSSYSTDVKRRTRWIRGDWQVAAWQLPWVPGADKHLKRNPLSVLSRWKIFDNIRRSIVPIALTAFLLLGWTLLGHPLFWTLAVSFIIVLPVIVTSFWDVFKKPKDLVISQHIILYSVNTWGIFIKTFFSLICLPHEALYSLVAIVKTCWRMLLSHRHLLEWSPAAMEERVNQGSILGSYTFMWTEPFLAIFTFIFLFLYFPHSLSIAIPILVLWIVAPSITWWTSQPLVKQVHKLTHEQIIFLRALAKKTWEFFERFVGEKDNWLPPDNYQENPNPQTAHRTSPTNIGMYLLSNLSALDFGYQSASQFLERTRKTFETMGKVEKYKGHLYNWYDTETLTPLNPKYVSTVDSGNLVGNLLTLKQGIAALLNHDSEKIAEEEKTLVQDLMNKCDEYADVDWSFLYDKNKNLLTIGYKPEEHQSDAGFYDLLASEARLGIYTAIAQGKIPEEAWFALSRLITNTGSAQTLLSWSGSMFEYLMPLLVMPTYENTLLDQTYKTSVKRQIEYGNQRGIPWGNSESGYNVVDASSSYQYKAFGTPGLGLKRGLGDDLVIAPYAAALALMIEPEKASQNLQLMSEKGFEGEYGFYEAVDYTSSRLQRGQTKAVIHQYMTHHQGMTLLSLAYVLLDKPMQKYFESEPQFKANLLLLQERIPKITSHYAHTGPTLERSFDAGGTVVRVLNNPNTPVPEVQLLSNGKYHVMITNSGGGYSRWKDMSVTRWREDATRDNWGSFCYIKDLENQTYWSGTYQPTLKKVQHYEVAFSPSRVDFRGAQNDIEMHTEIVVSPEDDIEMRRLNLTNNSNFKKTIEVTSYAEVVLANPAADLLQPAFSNMFVQTEIIKGRNAIICTRRPKAAGEQPPWMFHSMTSHNITPDEVSYETNRMEFIGRCNTVSNPLAMQKPGPLSNSEGSVLDPIVAIRFKITLKPGQTASIDMITGACESREICKSLIEKYYDSNHKNRIFELAWTHSQVVLRHIEASESDAQVYSRLAGSVIFANPVLRANGAVLIKNRRGQSGLWGYSISGDLPIVLLLIKDLENIQFVKQLIQAHTYWHLKGLMVDLVIWNEDHGGYRQQLQGQIQDLIAAEVTDKPGGIFVRSADQVSSEDRILFQTVARLVLSDSEGTLADHINRKAQSKVPIPYINVVPASEVNIPDTVVPDNLQFFNGTGGFSRDGDEYVIILNGETRTPAPWVNVIANPLFGTVISETGQAYSWAENAHEFRLSPWNDDPVSDSGGEAFYIRDEETGRFWSPTLLPAGGKSQYTVKHGMGYSIFEHTEEGIHTEMWVYADLEYTIKFTMLKIRNTTDKPRRLSATGYVEWVLGDQRTKTAMYTFTELDPGSGAIFAKNPYNPDFAGYVAFFDVDERRKTVTGDRTEFIGRNGSLKNPDGMNRVRLSGKLGGGLDPCAAIQITFELGAGEEREIVFRLGTCANINDVSNIVKKFRGLDEANMALEKVKQFWKRTTGALKAETPDAATNILTNSWLTYQVISSRLWGRSGYYQSGGAFGFRDQLQDVLSLFHTKPELGRTQILLAASRQFMEGDVQHWWHPPSGRGVRTHCSDDYLWLPYVTSEYITQTGDLAILDSQVPFIEGRQLNAEEESYYDMPIQSNISGRLYDHCVKAIKHAFRYGGNGLPLMGTGDWNDGMDRVGKQGKGESVWLAFFLYRILDKFIELAEMYNDTEFVDECKKESENLKANIEKNGWDGKWYRRAYFDDGTPLGSSQNVECKIDSLPQSWSVISKAGEESRTHLAMDSAYRYLVHKDEGFISLLDPPFDKSGLDPGYIKGYVPGVRENGGQYTHAAVWLTIAYAQMGESKKAWQLLNMINPVNHGKTSEDIAKYKVEPYVVAADIYSLSPFSGRGGWTWYTGSASWLYQLITQHLLGIRQHGIKLSFSPCIPAEWQTYKVHYRFGDTFYHILFEQKNAEGKMQVFMDGVLQADGIITLLDDSIDHAVNVTLFSKKTSLLFQASSLAAFQSTNQVS